MRSFTVNRITDVSGVSGIGRIAEGVEFHDGQVAVSWFGQHHILEVAKDIQTWIDVHGHEGKTLVEWEKPASSAESPPSTATSSARVK